MSSFGGFGGIGKIFGGNDELLFFIILFLLLFFNNRGKDNYYTNPRA